jgi:hypothetical protein
MRVACNIYFCVVYQQPSLINQFMASTVYDKCIERRLRLAQRRQALHVAEKAKMELLLTNLSGDNANADVLAARQVCAAKIASEAARVTAADAGIAEIQSQAYNNLSVADKNAVDYMLSHMSEQAAETLFSTMVSPPISYADIHARAQAGYASIGASADAMPQAARDAAYSFAFTRLLSERQ